MYILKIYIKGTYEEPVITKGRFRVINRCYSDDIFCFTTKAKDSEKLFDIIKELNDYSQLNYHSEKNTKIYLDKVIFDDKKITILELGNNYINIFLDTFMYKSEEIGKSCKIWFIKG